DRRNPPDGARGGSAGGCERGGRGSRPAAGSQPRAACPLCFPPAASAAGFLRRMERAVDFRNPLVFRADRGRGRGRRVRRIATARRGQGANLRSGGGGQAQSGGGDRQLVRTQSLAGEDSRPAWLVRGDGGSR